MTGRTRKSAVSQNDKTCCFLAPGLRRLCADAKSSAPARSASGTAYGCGVCKRKEEIGGVFVKVVQARRSDSAAWVAWFSVRLFA